MLTLITQNQVTATGDPKDAVQLKVALANVDEELSKGKAGALAGVWREQAEQLQAPPRGDSPGGSPRAEPGAG